MLKKNGFKYIENNKENIISFINDIEKIIDKNFDPKKNLNSLSFDNFNKLIFKTQNEINRKHHPINFAKRFPNIFKRELSSDKFYFQHYFYLRATRPANKVKGKAMANEKPNILMIGAIPPLVAASTKAVPATGKVHEN